MLLLRKKKFIRLHLIMSPSPYFFELRVDRSNASAPRVALSQHPASASHMVSGARRESPIASVACCGSEAVCRNTYNTARDWISARFLGRAGPRDDALRESVRWHVWYFTPTERELYGAELRRVAHSECEQWDADDALATVLRVRCGIAKHTGRGWIYSMNADFNFGLLHKLRQRMNAARQRMHR